MVAFAENKIRRGTRGFCADADTQNYYVRNGYYAAHLGRWLTRDPIGYQGGINLYEYVSSKPVSSLDSRGTNTCEAVVGAMHWLDGHWTLSAILPGTMLAAPPIAGTAGDFEPLVIFTRRYVQLFKCCKGGRVVAIWGKVASAARRETDSSPADINPGVALGISIPFPLPYGQVAVIPGVTFGIYWTQRFNLSQKVFPVGRTIWVGYKPQVPPGYRLVRHISCDCPPYRWPPAGGIPNPPVVTPLNISRAYEPLPGVIAP